MALEQQLQREAIEKVYNPCGMCQVFPEVHNTVVDELVEGLRVLGCHGVFDHFVYSSSHRGPALGVPSRGVPARSASG